MSKRFLDKERQLLVEVYDTDEIVANPTLDGTEDSLAGLQVGDTKYKVTGGGGGSVDAYELEITDFTPTAIEDEYQLSSELIAVVNEYRRPIYVNSQILTIFGITHITQMMAYPTSETPLLGGKHYSSLTLFDADSTGEIGEIQSGFSLYQISGDVYKIIFPQEQIIARANDPLLGNEETLTSLRVGNGLYKVPQGGGDIDVTSQELEEYFIEYCDTEAEIEEDNILALSNVDLENDDANDQILLVFNTDNVEVKNKVLEINTQGGLNDNE